MLLKTKLSLGLGFLFVIIFALAIFFSYSIGKLSQESDNILKDNYNSIIYSKNMISAMDDIRDSVISGILNPKDNKLTEYYTRLFNSGKNDFEINLKAENNNITEIHENEYVDTLNKNYEIFLNLCVLIKKESNINPQYFNEFQSVYEELRHSINDINDVNMQAVVRKNQTVKNESNKIIMIMAVVGSFCVILAFGYFWYFPFYISNSISYLSDKMKELLAKMGIVFDIKTNDETFVILHSINLLDNKFSLKGDDEKQK